MPLILLNNLGYLRRQVTYCAVAAALATAGCDRTHPKLNETLAWCGSLPANGEAALALADENGLVPADSLSSAEFLISRGRSHTTQALTPRGRCYFVPSAKDMVITLSEGKGPTLRGARLQNSFPSGALQVATLQRIRSAALLHKCGILTGEKPSELVSSAPQTFVQARTADGKIVGTGDLEIFTVDPAGISVPFTAHDRACVELKVAKDSFVSVGVKGKTQSALVPSTFAASLDTNDIMLAESAPSSVNAKCALALSKDVWSRILLGDVMLLMPDLPVKSSARVSLEACTRASDCSRADRWYTVEERATERGGGSHTARHSRFTKPERLGRCVLVAPSEVDALEWRVPESSGSAYRSSDRLQKANAKVSIGTAPAPFVQRIAFTRYFPLAVRIGAQGLSLEGCRTADAKVFVGERVPLRFKLGNLPKEGAGDLHFQVLAGSSTGETVALESLAKTEESASALNVAFALLPRDLTSLGQRDWSIRLRILSMRGESLDIPTDYACVLRGVVTPPQVALRPRGERLHTDVLAVGNPIAPDTLLSIVRGDAHRWEWELLPVQEREVVSPVLRQENSTCNDASLSPYSGKTSNDILPTRAGRFNLRVRACDTANQASQVFHTTVTIDGAPTRFRLRTAAPSGTPAIVRDLNQPLRVRVENLYDDELSFEELVEDLSCQVSLVKQGLPRTSPAACQVAQVDAIRKTVDLVIMVPLLDFVATPSGGSGNSSWLGSRLRVTVDVANDRRRFSRTSHWTEFVVGEVLDGGYQTVSTGLPRTFPDRRHSAFGFRDGTKPTLVSDSGEVYELDELAQLWKKTGVRFSAFDRPPMAVSEITSWDGETALIGSHTCRASGLCYSPDDADGARTLDGHVFPGGAIFIVQDKLDQVWLEAVTGPALIRTPLRIDAWIEPRFKVNSQGRTVLTDFAQQKSAQILMTTDAAGARQLSLEECDGRECHANATMLARNVTLQGRDIVLWNATGTECGRHSGAQEGSRIKVRRSLENAGRALVILSRDGVPSSDATLSLLIDSKKCTVEQEWVAGNERGADHTVTIDSQGLVFMERTIGVTGPPLVAAFNSIEPWLVTSVLYRNIGKETHALPSILAKERDLFSPGEWTAFLRPYASTTGDLWFLSSQSDPVRAVVSPFTRVSMAALNPQGNPLPPTIASDGKSLTFSATWRDTASARPHSLFIDTFSDNAQIVSENALDLRIDRFKLFSNAWQLFARNPQYELPQSAQAISIDEETLVRTESFEENGTLSWCVLVSGITPDCVASDNELRFMLMKANGDQSFVARVSPTGALVDGQFVTTRSLLEIGSAARLMNQIPSFRYRSAEGWKLINGVMLNAKTGAVRNLMASADTTHSKSAIKAIVRIDASSCSSNGFVAMSKKGGGFEARYFDTSGITTSARSEWRMDIADAGTHFFSCGAGLASWCAWNEVGTISKRVGTAGQWRLETVPVPGADSGAGYFPIAREWTREWEIGNAAWFPIGFFGRNTNPWPLEPADEFLLRDLIVVEPEKL